MAFAQELDGFSCQMCRNTWTEPGNHRICRLPGGQLYCKSCIEKLFRQMMDFNKEGGGDGEENECKVKFLEVGFWGGIGGKSWDDGFYDGVREITLEFGHCISSIQVVYGKDGSPVFAKKHGNKGDSTAVIKLDYPEEYIICVSGSVFSVKNGPLVIRSITFETNQRTFGPYGIAEGLPFIFPLEGVRIVGFKGRSGDHLDAIGFHVTKDRFR